MSVRKNISWFLMPLTGWYAVGVALRNFAYNIGLARSEAPRVITIGVGNLASGGTGKTPMVEHLAKLLTPHYRVAYLSRGYRRTTKGFVLNEGDPNPLRIGDEAAMIALRHPQLVVAVCEKRLEGINRLMALPEPPDVILLDDSYQHRAVVPSLNILLTEYNRPYYKDYILPFGDLREFRTARYRAGIVVVTKSPASLNPIEKHNIANDLRLKPYQKTFFSYIGYGQPLTLAGQPTEPLSADTKVLLVTGIANPEPLLNELRKTYKVTHIRFSDHHRYTQRDVATITAAYERLGGEHRVVLTTEKDAVKLRSLFAEDGSVPVCYVPIEPLFHPTNEQDMDSVVLSLVRENIHFLSKLSASTWAEKWHY
ncbi:MAG: tetraacyldisaccharide 4'-kinase [Bacteroidales bacterium]|nr:tetraacyldisaccharide 4'-kinase [Bacteroidales bacterium]